MKWQKVSRRFGIWQVNEGGLLGSITHVEGDVYMWSVEDGNANLVSSGTTRTLDAAQAAAGEVIERHPRKPARAVLV